ncbi:uncharacterized protein LOC131436561 [Malaya genurostris]|uniref:uncharacterized protein LOC131436561 n=1 Tax=Malaya genurostris TaxID=325434 RepID=UPI0026F40570|nr:uncharacterized protein LOC131436561 [Malaya genurostris]
MGASRVVFQLCCFAILWLTIQGRAIDYDLYNEISENFQSTAEVSTTVATTTTTEQKTETTTEYKHKDIIQAYTVKVPQLHSIRHAAGTHYFAVRADEDLTEKLLEVQREVFDRPFSRTPPPRRVAPPKNK